MTNNAGRILSTGGSGLISVDLTKDPLAKDEVDFLLLSVMSKSF
jgi:hypothetical protein